MLFDFSTDVSILNVIAISCAKKMWENKIQNL